MRNVKLKRIGISSTFSCTISDIECELSVVQKVTVCQGISAAKCLRENLSVFIRKLGGFWIMIIQLLPKSHVNM